MILFTSVLDVCIFMTTLVCLNVFVAIVCLTETNNREVFVVLSDVVMSQNPDIGQSVCGVAERDKKTFDYSYKNGSRRSYFYTRGGGTGGRFNTASIHSASASFSFIGLPE